MSMAPLRISTPGARLGNTTYVLVRILDYRVQTGLIRVQVILREVLPATFSLLELHGNSKGARGESQVYSSLNQHI